MSHEGAVNCQTFRSVNRKSGVCLAPTVLYNMRLLLWGPKSGLVFISMDTGRDGRIGYQADDVAGSLERVDGLTVSDVHC